MTHQTPPEHFMGQTVSEHLKEARRKGALATSESHALEPSGWLSAACDSAKDLSNAFLILWTITFTLRIPLIVVDLKIPLFGSAILLFLFGFGWVIFKAARSAVLGWERMERLHKVIEEERWEIEHHHEQEKLELRQMYANKGFSGKLLDDVVNTLSSDDNRLLEIMLEEELGLSLESYEHPLKQALGALAGATIAGIIALGAFFSTRHPFSLPIACLFIILITSHLTGFYEKRKKMKSIIWNLAISVFTSAAVYFFVKMLLP